MPIEYVTTDDIDLVGPMWLRLLDHHRAVNPEFFAAAGPPNWEQRKAGLLKTTAGGQLRIDLARDAASGRHVGYCITSLTADCKGEIESLFVEADVRRMGIGGGLMKRALRFLDEAGAVVRTLGVAAGNEEVLGFYRRYGFVPRSTILQQLPDRSPGGSSGAAVC